jgi:AraC-like DNA-binding protein
MEPPTVNYDVYISQRKGLQNPYFQQVIREKESAYKEAIPRTGEKNRIIQEVQDLGFVFRDEDGTLVEDDNIIKGKIGSALRNCKNRAGVEDEAVSPRMVDPHPAPSTNDEKIKAHKRRTVIVKPDFMATRSRLSNHVARAPVLGEITAVVIKQEMIDTDEEDLDRQVAQAPVTIGANPFASHSMDELVAELTGSESMFAKLTREHTEKTRKLQDAIDIKKAKMQRAEAHMNDVVKEMMDGSNIGEEEIGSKAAAMAKKVWKTIKEQEG